MPKKGNNGGGEDVSQVESGHTVSVRVEGGGAFLVEGNLVLDGSDHCLEPNLQRSSKGW